MEQQVGYYRRVVAQLEREKVRLLEVLESLLSSHDTLPQWAWDEVMAVIKEEKNSTQKRRRMEKMIRREEA